MDERVVVVGAGVIGLSCAIRLLESGVAVDVVAADDVGDTTSAVAGGLWLPYRAEPADRVAAWAARTLDELIALHAAGDPAISLRRGRLLHRDRPVQPTWTELVAEVAQLQELTDPAPGYGFGYEARLPVVDTPRYLVRLRDRVVAGGGRLRRERLQALPSDGIVVNATGLAARELARDSSVYAVRGQTVVVENPGLDEWVCDEDETPDGALTYVLPRSDDVVVGGTAHERDERRDPDPAQSAAIQDRAFRLVPRLRGARVKAVRVGLRPARPAVRLETEGTPGGVIVHCYGHGGAGVTLSWGCAEEVADVVARLLDRPNVARARQSGVAQ